MVRRPEFYVGISDCVVEMRLPDVMTVTISIQKRPKRFQMIKALAIGYSFAPSADSFVARIEIFGSRNELLLEQARAGEAEHGVR
jgi:hypothetical protein